MPDIFLSYSRADQAMARRYADAFKAAGFDLWWDVGLQSGEAYDEVTENALRTARAVVVLWSQRSVVSRWVKSEATLADRNGSMVPVMIEPCERPVMFELVQTADLCHWRGESDDRKWLVSLDEVRRVVERDKLPERVEKPVAAARETRGEQPSLAVLPLTNLSRDPEQDYFAQGMTQEITTALSRIRSIFVIASTSTQGMSGNVDVQAVGRQLGVRYVLQGSVRKAGGRIRIAVNLIDAADGSQVCSEKYDGGVQDLFELQDSVALNVAGKIEPALLDAEIKRAVRRPTANASAYDMYLRAIALLDTFERDAMFKCIGLLDEAIATDPQYAQAMAVASYAYGQVVVSQWSGDLAHYRETALDLGRRAVRQGGDDAEVLSWVIGAYLSLQEDLDTSLALANRCIALNPGSAQGWMMSGWVHMSLGDPDTAIAHLETCMRLDPNSSDRRFHVGGIAFCRFAKGEFAEAARMIKEVIQLEPAVSMNHALLVSAQGHLGQIDAAKATAERYRILSHIDMRERLTNFRKPEHRELYLAGLRLAGVS